MTVILFCLHTLGWCRWYRGHRDDVDGSSSVTPFVYFQYYTRLLGTRLLDRTSFSSLFKILWMAGISTDNQ